MRHYVKAAFIAAATIPLALIAAEALPAGADTPTNDVVSMSRLAVAHAAAAKTPRPASNYDIKWAIAHTTATTLVAPYLLGSISANPRTAVFGSISGSSPSAPVCIHFSTTINTAPIVKTCPLRIVPSAVRYIDQAFDKRLAPQASAVALSVSRDAIAAAALNGKAVSSKDLIAAAGQYNATPASVYLISPYLAPAGEVGSARFGVFLHPSPVYTAYSNVCVGEPSSSIGSPVDLGAC